MSTCTLDDCGLPRHAHGYCRTHMHRWLKHGDPLHPVTVVNADERLEDLRWMAETGEGLTGAAERLDMKVKTVERFLRRNDRDCLALLIDHEPKDHNRYLAKTVNVSELTGLSERLRRRKRVAA